MAITDYFEDITVLQQIGNDNEIGGRNGSWTTVTTIRGRINKSYSNQDNSKGRENNQDEYKGFFEYSSTNLVYLKPEYACSTQH